MKGYPPIPRIEDAPDGLLESGHLWLTELVDGARLRVQLRESGLLRFGDAERVYDDPEAIPLSYRCAVRHVRERLDRDALRAAVEDVESVVLFGVATRYQTIEYDWDRIPPFLGVGVWTGDAGRFLPPDAAAKTFERLGLDPVNAVERELNTRDFDPDAYTVPDSAWYDGPARGVVVRNKKGGLAKLLPPDFKDPDGPAPVEASAEELADRYATDGRFEAIAAELRDRGDPVSFETLRERALERIVREEYGRLFHPASSVDLDAFRSAVAERTGTFLSRADE
jgi:hypothetical protein